MSEITIIGLDLAKSVFHAVGSDEAGREVFRKRLRRSEVLEFFAQHPATVVVMEACGGSNYWARELMKLGHEVKLIPAQRVKAFLQGNKTDYLDARAMVEAARQPSTRCVPVKTVGQQDIQALHRVREALIGRRTALCNQTRGLLAEYGIVLAKGVGTLRRAIPELLEDAENGLSPVFRELLSSSYEQLRELDGWLKANQRQLERLSEQNPGCRRLRQIPGYGPLLSSLFAAVVGDGRNYARGRDASASVGVVPRQHSTGGREQLLGISKRGNRHLRTLLVHGARAVLMRAGEKDDRLSRWANKVRERRGYNRAVVALANKLARIGWAVLRYEADYRPA